jgi:hypothetical protein
MKKITKKLAIMAYKVFDPNWICNGSGSAAFQFALGKIYKHDGPVQVCRSGFHACLQLAHCFSYYSFDPKNKVAEVRVWGDVDEHESDSKICGSHIEIVREVSWDEVLRLANTGSGNTGHSNSGDQNSGDQNSGYRNSGNRNSGNRNSGDQNSGYRNSGNRNSGDQNSGNWNSGNRNSGDQNSGYRNSGAFCSDPNPFVTLFDQPTKIRVRDWEQHEAVKILERSLETHIWVYGNSMSDAEKEAHPHWETTDGYLKAISLKEAWANMWPNLDEKSRKVFLTLPNFDAAKFEQITGIKPEVKA